MRAIERDAVQEALDSFCGEPVYLHVETTNGAYARNPFGMFGRNLVVRFRTARIAGGAGVAGGRTFRVALQLVRSEEGAHSPEASSSTGAPAPSREASPEADGWLYVEGLTHWELDDRGRLLLAGHDERGLLTAALELSREPFPLGRGA